MFYIKYNYILINVVCRCFFIKIICIMYFFLWFFKKNYISIIENLNDLGILFFDYLICLFFYIYNVYLKCMILFKIKI